MYNNYGKKYNNLISITSIIHVNSGVEWFIFLFLFFSFFNDLIFFSLEGKAY